MTTTAPAPAASVAMTYGREVRYIDVDGTKVTEVGMTRTSHGANVGGVREKSFATEADARAYANGRYFALKAKGYHRSK